MTTARDRVSVAELAVFPRNLPGADLVASGLEALRRGDMTVEALLVLIGAPRLRAAGLDVPAAPPADTSPEIALYLAIEREHPADAHSRYNALIRRLVSFERALEALQGVASRIVLPEA